jgi:hypothetical protein
MPRGAPNALVRRICLGDGARGPSRQPRGTARSQLVSGTVAPGARAPVGLRPLSGADRLFMGPAAKGRSGSSPAGRQRAEGIARINRCLVESLDAPPRPALGTPPPFPTVCTRENETVKKPMLAGMLAVPLMASVAWADCLKDDPYYRCFDWYYAPPGEAYMPPTSVKTLAGARKMRETMSTSPGFCAPLLAAILR